MPSQQQASQTPNDARDEWRTPRFVFDYMDRLHAFAVDLAATEENTLCNSYITRGENALEQQWGRWFGTAWCNPPYSDLKAWMAKAVEEARAGTTTVMLVPNPNGQMFYADHVFGVASEVMFICGRLSFLTPDGKPKAGNTQGSCLVTYRGFDLGNTRYSFIRRDEMLGAVTSWRNGEAAA